MASPASIVHGPSLIGTFFNVFLCGIMFTQCFLYYTRYKNDKLWIKVMVFVLLLADTLNAAFDIWWIYNSLITNFTNVAYLATGNWIPATDPALIGIIACIVQLFFAWRVNILTHNLWIVAVIVFTAFGSCLSGIGTAIAIHFVPQFEQWYKIRGIVIPWLSCAVIGDLTITVSLTWHLQRHRTGFAETDSILNRIIRLTMQNSLLTAVWAILDLIIYLANPTGLHLVFNIPLAKLYTNSLMSSLNSRDVGRHQTSEDTNTRSRDTIGNARKPEVVKLSTITRPEVYVDVETHESIDGDKRNLEWSQDSSSRASVKDLDTV